VLALVIASLVTFVTETWGKGSPALAPASHYHYGVEHHMVTNVVSIVAFGFASGGPFALLVLLFGGAPTIAAFVTAAIAWGGAGVRRLVSRLKPWRQGVTARQALRVYGVVIGLYLAGLALALWFSKTHGTEKEWSLTWSALGGTPLFALCIALVAMFLDDGASFEEMGWRGFALPYLQKNMRVPLVAALVLGVLHWAWHLPREMPAMLSGHSWIMPYGSFKFLPWAQGESMFAIYVILLSIICAYCYNLTGGSVWPAILIHGGTNVWGKSYAMDPLYRFSWTHWHFGDRSLDPRAIVALLAVALILAFAGPRLGLRSDADSVEGSA
jgi:hypothetical protein